MQSLSRNRRSRSQYPRIVLNKKEISASVPFKLNQMIDNPIARSQGPLINQYSQPTFIEGSQVSHQKPRRMTRTQQSQSSYEHSSPSNARDLPLLRNASRGKQVSPENRQLFKLKLRYIEESISFIRNRNKVGDSQANLHGRITQMLTSLRKGTAQPQKMETEEHAPTMANIQEQLVRKSFGISEIQKRQRDKLRSSVYFKGSCWREKKRSIIENILKLDWYQKRILYARLKIPYLRELSKNLFRAVRQKNYQEALRLVTLNKFLVHEVDQSQQTPLHISAQYGLYDITKLFLRFNIDVNCVDSNGKTPLFYALANCHVELVKLLIAYDAQPWSYATCNYAQFYSNSKLKSVMRVARRYRTLYLLTPKKKRMALKEFFEQCTAQEYKLPPTLL